MSDTDEAEGQNNFQVFVKGDRIKEPVKFYLHSSLTIGQQEKLERGITNNGGIVIKDPKEADTVLVHYEHFDEVAKRYDHSKTIWVEKPDFVDVCLRRKQYYHAKPIKKSLGGRPAGIGIHRREFTSDDDYCLAEYLARRIPNPQSGGRKGYGVYRELCDPERSEMYPWADRHSVDSWRNRYRSNQERFDRLIEDYLVYNPPHPDGKGEYRHDKRATGLGKRPASRHRYIKKSGREQEEIDEEERESEAEDGEEAESIPVKEARSRAMAEPEDKGAPASQGERKRRKIDGADSSSPVTPEQARQGQQHDSRRKDTYAAQQSQELLNSNLLYQFDDDNFRGLDDLYDEAGPGITQATLVAVQPKSRPPEKSSVSIEAPAASTLSTKPRMAARNKERSATAKSGATGQTAFSSSPPKDTQATLVATQRNTRPSTQAESRKWPAAPNSLPAGAVTSSRSINVAVPVETRGPNLSRSARDQQPNPIRLDNKTDDVIIADGSRPSGVKVFKPSPLERVVQSTPASRPSVAAQTAVPGSAARARTDLEIQSRKRLASQAKIGTADAPYRNTRARSRSVEPAVMAPPPPPVAAKGKGKALMRTVEEREEDVQSESDGFMADAETHDEQQSMEAVENTLFIKKEEEEEDTEQNERKSGEGEEGSGEENEEEEDHSDEGEGEESYERSTAASFFRNRAKNLEKKDINAIESTPQQTPTSRPPLSAGKAGPPSLQVRFKKPSRRAESSEGEFPTPGTRSREAKARQEQLERTVPFIPTPGTRAEGARAVQQAQMTEPRRKAKKTVAK